MSYTYKAPLLYVLEKIQHRATKLVSAISSLSYVDRLKYLGLYSLYRHRQSGGLIEAFKIINKVSNTSLSFPMLNTSYHN